MDSLRGRRTLSTLSVRGGFDAVQAKARDKAKAKARRSDTIGHLGPEAVVAFRPPKDASSTTPDLGVMLAMGAAGVAIFTKRRLLGWVALYLGLNRSGRQLLASN